MTEPRKFEAIAGAGDGNGVRLAELRKASKGCGPPLNMRQSIPNIMPFVKWLEMFGANVQLVKQLETTRTDEHST